MVSELRRRFSAEISRISSLFLTSTPSFSDSRRFHGRNSLNFSQIVRNSIEINPRKFQIKIHSLSGSKLDLNEDRFFGQVGTAHPDGLRIAHSKDQFERSGTAYPDESGSLIRSVGSLIRTTS